MELTSGIIKTTLNIYRLNKSSLFRTLIYTLGQFIIAITVLTIVEPIANSIWYFILDKWWINKSK